MSQNKIDRDVILAKIHNIKNCLFALEKVKRSETDPMFRQGLYELNLQRAVQSCVDMAHLIISQEGLGLPNSYRHAFEILSNHNIISPSLKSKMISMVGFRNISVHDYETIKPEIVESIINNNLPDFEEYYTVIYNYIQSNP